LACWMAGVSWLRTPDKTRLILFENEEEMDYRYLS
jgi:hypothetical protein